MNFLNIFEDRVSGIFGAARAPFSFKKLAKQAAREMEDQTLVINGANTAPALYTVLISGDDDPLLAPYYPQLAREVCEFVKAQAEKKRYLFVGEPLARFMIDPSLKAGKFSVFAENVDAPTLGRLYEEERAYQNGLSGNLSRGNSVKLGGSPAPAAAPAPAPAASRAPMPAAASAPAQPQAQSVNGIPNIPGFGGEADPFAPATPAAAGLGAGMGLGAAAAAGVAEVAAPVAVPQTVSRAQLAGMGGAAATGAALGTASAAAHAAPRPARPLAQLVDVVTGDTYDLTSAQCIVGRERMAADVALRDPNVSRRHAQLTFTGAGDWSIEDLNSTNGTLVNNRRITRCPLRNGDLLTFGLSTFEFRS